MNTFRGMRSKNQAAVPFDPVKVETIPLLTTTMESEILKQQQNLMYQRQPMMTLQNGGIPQYTQNSIPIQSTTIPRILKNPMEEENLSNWEENFQDLSGWCLGTQVQNRCNFPIGESINQAYKLIGNFVFLTKNIFFFFGIPKLFSYSN